jgi:hypothetical protein
MSDLFILQTPLPELVLRAAVIYLCGVEGAEREGSLRKGGGESGAPSSLSHRTGILYAGGSPR